MPRTSCASELRGAEGRADAGYNRLYGNWSRRLASTSYASGKLGTCDEPVRRVRLKVRNGLATSSRRLPKPPS